MRRRVSTPARAHRLRGLALATGLAVVAGSLRAQNFDAPPSLRTVPVPQIPRLDATVRDRAAAIALGKALFWDQQMGSDAAVTCAACHFHAGADARSLNQLHPGRDGRFEIRGVNQLLQPADFPFHQLADPLDSGSTVLFDTDDVVGSQGIVSHRYDGFEPGVAAERGTLLPDSVFFDARGNARQVVPRNAPSVIDAVFNRVNFLDGRAASVFNGVDLEGERNSAARILMVSPDGAVRATSVRFESASLASQAVTPPMSHVEMAYAGRTFMQLGKKLLGLRALALQEVHPHDSVLGPLRHDCGTGLRSTYAELVRAAFRDAYWNSDVLVDGDLNVVGRGTPSSPQQFTAMEANFSLFLGLAIQLYESTLVADDTPFDRFQSGDATALTSLQQEGLVLFVEEGRCLQCHGGPEFTEAASGHFDSLRAFANSAVRPEAEDPGFGNGRFKTPGLRNVELTGPYFHNGGQATLRQVVEFYNRGGDFSGPHTDIDVRPLELSDDQMQRLVAFLIGLTDERVRYERAPFDHPSLVLPNGPVLPAVGAEGGAPLRTFLGLSPYERDAHGSLPISNVVIEPLHRNPIHPNPNVVFRVPQSSGVRLGIYDTTGRRVRLLSETSCAQGSRSIDWDARDARGKPVTAGVYFVHLESGGRERTSRLVLLR